MLSKAIDSDLDKTFEAEFLSVIVVITIALNTKIH